MRNVYCEPFRIERGYTFDIHHVSYQEDQSYSCFLHFHQVHEFIIFDDIEGCYFFNQGQSRLQANDIVFTPALEAHDFELSNKEKSWHIVQVLPEFFQNEGLTQCESLFKQGMHLRLPKNEVANIKQQVKWLLASYQNDPNSEMSRTLLKLLVLWIAQHGESVKTPHGPTLQQSTNMKKLMPIINEFRHDSVVDITMVEAAKSCYMSPSYFSRQFKKVFKYSFTEYLLRHKLYLAARLLGSGQSSITEISYDLNFSSPSHFIAQFKRQFGSTPLQYQKLVLNREQ